MSIIQTLFFGGGVADGVLKLDNRTLSASNYTIDNGIFKTINIHFGMRANGTAHSYYNATGGLSGLSDSGGFGEYGSFGEWISGGIPSTYSVRVTSIGDTVYGSSLNSWLPMNTNRDWYVTASGISGSDFVSSTLTISIAKTSDTSTILETAGITLSALLFIESII